MKQDCNLFLIFKDFEFWIFEIFKRKWIRKYLLPIFRIIKWSSAVSKPAAVPPFFPSLFGVLFLPLVSGVIVGVWLKNISAFFAFTRRGAVWLEFGVVWRRAAVWEQSRKKAVGLVAVEQVVGEVTVIGYDNAKSKITSNLIRMQIQYKFFFNFLIFKKIKKIKKISNFKLNFKKFYKILNIFWKFLIKKIKIWKWIVKCMTLWWNMNICYLLRFGNFILEWNLLHRPWLHLFDVGPPQRSQTRPRSGEGSNGRKCPGITLPL